MRIISVDECIDLLENYNHKELHCHHTWRPDHSDFNGHNHIQLQENMRNYHVNTRKWSDIGQHITIMPDGKIVTGRDFGRNPASIRGYNSGGFCVEMLGNFDKGKDIFGGKQKESMIKIARFFHDRGKYIRFHRENSSKTCPGTSISKDDFMQDVKDYKGGNSMKGWQINIAHDAIDSLAEKGHINNAETWKERVEKDPQRIIEDMPWLLWVMFDRISEK